MLQPLLLEDTVMLFPEVHAASPLEFCKLLWLYSEAYFLKQGSKGVVMSNRSWLEFTAYVLYGENL